MLEFQANTIDFSHDLTQISPLTDDLGRVKIAQAIAEQLRQGDERPRVIGVYGWWGSGKTHLLSQTIHLLQEGNRESKVQIIPCAFQSWKYEMTDDLAPGLIKSLMNVNEQFDNDSLFKDPQTYKSLGQGLLDLLAIVGPVTGPAGQAAGLLAQLVKWGVGNVGERQEAITKNVSQVDIDDISKKMEDLVQAILKSASDKDSSKQYRLVVFIDDLDRCSPDNMVRMFEWLKVHLAVRGCTYVLALDNIAAARAIVGRYKKYLSSEADLEYGLRYLEKLIDQEYELGLPLETDLQAMTIQRIFNRRYNKLSAAIGSRELYDLGSERTCYAYINQLLALRALRNPRTMLKIGYKYKSTLDILTRSEAGPKALREQLTENYPFWSSLLVAMYYRLAPDDVNDFIQGRGYIFGLFGSPSSISKEHWPADKASPMYQFCQLAHDLKEEAADKLVLPSPRALRHLAAIIRENAFTGADSISL